MIFEIVTFDIYLILSVGQCRSVSQTVGQLSKYKQGSSATSILVLVGLSICFSFNLAFQYNMLMRLGMVEDAIDNLSKQIELLGGRIESTDSIFHFEKMGAMHDFDLFEKQL